LTLHFHDPKNNASYSSHIKPLYKNNDDNNSTEPGFYRSNDYPITLKNLVDSSHSQ